MTQELIIMEIITLQKIHSELGSTHWLLIVYDAVLFVKFLKHEGYLSYTTMLFLKNMRILLS